MSNQERPWDDGPACGRDAHPDGDGRCYFHGEFEKDSDEFVAALREYEAGLAEGAALDCTRFVLPEFKWPWGEDPFPRPVVFREAQFSGPANFVGAQFAATADFEGARFAGTADFDGAHFVGHAKFEDVQFTGQATFGGTHFRAHVNLDHARFAGHANFGDAQFTGRATFWHARFTVTVDFEGALFTGHAYFVNAHFTGRAFMLGTQFTGGADFADTRFIGPADFEGARFMGPTGFRGAQFSRLAGFEGAGFAGPADFQLTEFEEPTHWLAVIVGAPLDFRFATFKGLSDWTDARLSAAGSIDLREVHVEAELRLQDLWFAGADQMEAVRAAVATTHAAFWQRLTKNIDLWSCPLPPQLDAEGARQPDTRLDLRNLHIGPDARVRIQGVNCPGDPRGRIDASKMLFAHTDVSRIRFQNVKWEGERPWRTRLGALLWPNRAPVWRVADEFYVRDLPGRRAHPEFEPPDGEGLDPSLVADIYKGLRASYEENLRYSDAGRFHIREMEMRRLARGLEGTRDAARTGEASGVGKAGEGGGAVEAAEPGKAGAGTLSWRWLRRNVSLLNLYRLTSNYGESPGRVLATMFLLGGLVVLGGGALDYCAAMDAFNGSPLLGAEASASAPVLIALNMTDGNQTWNLTGQLVNPTGSGGATLHSAAPAPVLSDHIGSQALDVLNLVAGVRYEAAGFGEWLGRATAVLLVALLAISLRRNFRR